MAVLTIDKYLRGKVGYTIPDDTIASITEMRRRSTAKRLSVALTITPSTTLDELDTMFTSYTEDETLRFLDLCTADVYVYCASTPSAISSDKNSDGNWTVESGGMQHSAYDARQLRAMAQSIYDTYGETVKTRNIVKITTL